MEVKCNEKEINIIGEGYKLVISVKEGLELARKIEEYYFMEDEDDD